MRFSLWPSAANPPAEIVAEARQADAEGWHGVWIADHYMPNTPDDTPSDGPTHEAWTLLPAIATATTRVRVGTLVSPTSIHHPAVLANRAATLDHLSGGRMVLGLGAGWQVIEHAAYGIELEPAGARVTRFEECLRVVRSLLSQPRTTFHGKVYDVTDAPCEPKPVQDRLPILVGTAGPRMLRITARYADEWNTWGTPEVAAAKRRNLEAACEQVGRDPGTLHCSVNAFIALEGERAPRERTLAGSPAQVVDLVGQYAGLGFDEFVLNCGILVGPAQRRRDAIARIRSEVLGQLG
ncbi:LLM class flavin-dependent oxidoreductase [Nocardioides sp.]|uniref:LLM class flavin-dependent oxidoreductase n=1 Tax=Nocardioides sp. TaxID=35761 RepID=UPI002C90DECD|nr:LLM class flavin-dependent oxidoreductase [Nocardioides sp.]HVX53198.1 LLM class flavin-dependent oxidoreductase [Nocardioides sp.]